MSAPIARRFPPMTRVAAAAALAATLAVAPAPAAADEPSAPIAWGGLATELSVAGVFALNFGTDLVPNHGPGMIVNFTPLVIGPVTGWGMRHVDAGPALAVHGAGWLGFDLFLLGALIDGRAERDRLAVGPAALTLGAVGALAGGYLGATAVDGRDESVAFMGGPPAGFVVGGLVLGGIYVLAGGLDGDKALSQFTTGAVAGLSIGLGVSTLMAYRGFGDTAPVAAAATLTPRLAPGRDRVLFSVGGSF